MLTYPFCREGLSPAEVAFIAESDLIYIQPRQNMPSLQLIDVGLLFDLFFFLILLIVNRRPYQRSSLPKGFKSHFG